MNTQRADGTYAITEQSDPQQSQWADPVYSARGNVTSIPKPLDLENSYACTYDAWNRLAFVWVDSGSDGDHDAGETVIARYEYDGLGRRVKKHRNTDTDVGRRRDPLVAGGLETRGVVADWSAWLRQGEDEEVLSRLRMRTRTGRPAGDAAFIARLEALSGRWLTPATGRAAHASVRHPEHRAKT